MTREAAYVDLNSEPDLPRLIHEVARNGRRVVLREGDTDLAILSPARPPRRRVPRKRITPADIKASLAAAGSWKGLLDPEELKRQLDRARSDDSAPVTL